VWRIFWILLIVGGGLFVADNFTYLKGQVEGLWGSVFNSAPSVPAPSVPAPTTPPIATPTPTTSPTPATGSSAGWLDWIQERSAPTKAILGNVIWYAIGIPVALFLLWHLSGKSRNIFVATAACLIALGTAWYYGQAVDNGFNRYGSASAASAPGTLPLNDAVKPAYVLPCNGQVFTLRLKKGDIVRNANRCHTSYRVEYRDDTSPSQLWFRASSQPPVLLTPTSTACKMGHCPELNEFEAVSETATLKIIGCPAGRLVQGEFACR
jgi:hypothetical protein